MKTWTKFSIVLGIASWALARSWGGPEPPSNAAAAIQAIQQASDPSAVVAAYANGAGIDRNDPKLYEAYVARMVDLGLPELAYHQAQSLTGLQSDNGLAWGVVAYVDARRGEMPDAISAINLAGQFATENLFVQRTAGEIVAWYDTKGSNSSQPVNAKEGLAKLRNLLDKRPAFTEAYNTAKNAYQAQANAPQAPAQAAPQGQMPSEQIAPQGYAEMPPPPPLDYPDYYYDWGPSWIEPAPWYWWQPVGFFGGFDFFPFSTVIVFDHRGFFDRHHFFVQDRGFFNDRFFHQGGLNVAFHGPNRAFFHRDGQTSFFGAVSRPNTAVTFSPRANFRAMPGPANNVSRGQTIREPAGAATSPMVTPPAPSSGFHSRGMQHSSGFSHSSGGGGHGHGGDGGRR